LFYRSLVKEKVITLCLNKYCLTVEKFQKDLSNQPWAPSDW